MSNLTAQIIKRYRKNKGLTQAELATAVGISQMSIRRYETLGEGNREPSADLFDKIAEALGTTSDVLRGKVSDYEFKDIPQGPVTNAEATKEYFKKKAPWFLKILFAITGKDSLDDLIEEALKAVKENFGETEKSEDKNKETTKEE